MTPTEVFLMDALLLDRTSEEDAAGLLPYVMPEAAACPGCDKDWVLMMNRDATLEVQLGRAGKRHLALLLEKITESCEAGHMPAHLRTDGERVWIPTHAPDGAR